MREFNFDGFVKSPSAAFRFTFVAAAYHPGTPYSSGFARRVPRNAGELFTKPSLWRLFTRSSIFMVTTYEKVRRKARAVDIIIGLALTFLIALLFFLPGSLGEVGQEKLYDLALGFRASPGVSRNIVILAIDDASVARIGRWPWPRKRIAELINFLSSAGAKLVAMDLFFPMAEGEREAGNDRLLGEATRRAGNIIYPFYFGFGRSSGEKGKDEIPPQIADAALLLFDDPKKFSDFPPPLAQELFAPIPEVASGARALGHINVLPDLDGKVRREPLLIAYAGYYF
ncbi:MAG: CHASE2 domain-containing protein, partial [Deltaproteobacteria bacterium]|nr:CHASE2 domain-containing protein [Deltaproteobacteria bacterium]